jgi:hypothetical protein
MVEITIHYQKFFLVIDTGADYATLLLKPAALQRITVHYLEDDQRSLDSQGKAYTARRFEIPSVQLGKLHFTNFQADEELREPASEDDGNIGNHLLNHFYALFDYQDSKMVLYPKLAQAGNYPRELGLKTWQKIHFIHNNLGIILNGKFDGCDQELQFCLDTGMTYQDEGISYGIVKPGHLQELSKGKHSLMTEHFYMDGIDCGMMRFQEYDFKEPPVDGFLGHNFFSQYKVLIDFDQRVLFIKKN